MRTRVFKSKDKDGNEVELEFRPPGQSIMSKAELVFKKTFSKCFRDGILTAAEVDKLLRERGIWDDEKEREALSLQVEIARNEDELNRDGISEKEAKKICDELVILRSKLMVHNDPIVSITENTCEAISNEERNQFLVTQCIYNKKTGMRVYKDIEEFKNTENEQVATDSYMETVIASLEDTMGQELSSDINQIHVENRWMAQYNQKKAKETEQEKDKTTKKKVAKKKKTVSN